MFSFLFSLIVGAFAGYVAARIMGSDTSLLKNILLGLLGSSVGGVLFSMVSLGSYGFVGNFIISVVGACVCIWVGRKLFH